MIKLTQEVCRYTDKVKYNVSLQSHETIFGRSYDAGMPIRYKVTDRILYYHINTRRNKGFLFNYLCKNNNKSYRKMSSYKYHSSCDQADVVDPESVSRYYIRLMMTISKMKV